MVNWNVKAKVKRGAPSNPRPHRRHSAAGRGERRSGNRPGNRVDRKLPGEQARQQQVAGAAEVLDLEVQLVDETETRRNDRGEDLKQVVGRVDNLEVFETLLLNPLPSRRPLLRYRWWRQRRRRLRRRRRLPWRTRRRRLPPGPLFRMLFPRPPRSHPTPRRSPAISRLRSLFARRRPRFLPRPFLHPRCRSSSQFGLLRLPQRASRSPRCAKASRQYLASWGLDR